MGGRIAGGGQVVFWRSSGDLLAAGGPLVGGGGWSVGVGWVFGVGRAFWWRWAGGTSLVDVRIVGGGRSVIGGERAGSLVVADGRAVW